MIKPTAFITAKADWRTLALDLPLLLNLKDFSYLLIILTAVSLSLRNSLSTWERLCGITKPVDTFTQKEKSKRD